jgi:hypothetical protein
MKKFISYLLILTFVFTYCKKEKEETSKQVKYTDEYKASHKAKYFIEIPDVYELSYIILALKDQSTPTYFVEKGTDYYNSVINSFGSYKSHELLSSLNFNYSDFNSYYSFITNSYKYHFDNGEIKNKDQYINIWNPDVFTLNLSEVQDFSTKSDFKGFYNNNLNYYKHQIDLYDSIVPISLMWEWVENQFDNKHDCYIIIISPLTNGSHCTQRFETSDYKETIIFVSGIHENLQKIDSISKSRFMQYVFTEIDHNYVNPVSDKFLSEINNSFSKSNIWTANNDINNLYGSPYAIFNEYMTWSVFNLFILDNFSIEYFNFVNEQVENQMINQRGFRYFDKFNEKLIELYNNKSSGQKIKDLYPQILEWAKQQ